MKASNGQLQAIKLLKRNLSEFRNFDREHLPDEAWTVNYEADTAQEGRFSAILPRLAYEAIHSINAEFEALLNKVVEFSKYVVFLNKYNSIEGKTFYMEKLTHSDNLAEDVEVKIEAFDEMLFQANKRIAFNNLDLWSLIAGGSPYSIEERKDLYQEVIDTRAPYRYAPLFYGTGLQLNNKNEVEGYDIYSTLDLWVSSIASATYQRLSEYANDTIVLQIMQIYCFLAYYKIVQDNFVERVKLEKNNHILSFAGITLDTCKLKNANRFSSISLNSNIKNYILQKNKKQFPSATQLLDHLCSIQIEPNLTNRVQVNTTKDYSNALQKGGDIDSNYGSDEKFCPEFLTLHKTKSGAKHWKEGTDYQGFRLVLQKN